MILLAGCAATPAVQGIRNTSAPISSIAVVDGNRLKGLWHEVAGYALHPACQPGTVGLTVEITGSDCYLPVPRQPMALTMSGPGRLTLANGTEFWVLWVDADYRTLVIGDPAGRFGAILNRDVVIPPDRLVAGKRVLEFNGYDLSRLQGG